MAALAPRPLAPAHSLVLARRPVPIVVTPGALAPIAMLAIGFAVYSARAGTLLVLGALALGGLGGAVSLIVHELGHVRAARRLAGVRPVRVSLLWVGAGTQFEGAYRSGRDQAKVALAGPAASLALALALLVAAVFPLPHHLQLGLFGLALLNAAIGVLTLLPVHPLDGHKLVVGLLWWLAGSERRAKGIVRRAGLACLALDGAITLFVLAARPAIGLGVIAVGAVVYGQKHLVARSARSAKPAG